MISAGSAEDEVSKLVSGKSTRTRMILHADSLEHTCEHASHKCTLSHLPQQHVEYEVRDPVCRVADTRGDLIHNTSRCKAKNIIAPKHSVRYYLHSFAFELTFLHND
jgi:hypothetical protein